MKKLSLIIVLTALLSNFLYAQKDSVFQTAIKPGAYSLEFGIGSDFTLTSFTGSTVSLKKVIDESTIYRAGLTIYGNYFNQSNDSKNLNQDTLTGSGWQSNKNKNLYINLNLDYLKYIPSTNYLKPYYGIGGYLGYGYNESPQDYSDRSVNSSYYSTNSQLSKQNILSTGVRGVLGCECFVTKSISIHSEYIIGAGFEYSKQKIDRKEIRYYNGQVIRSTADEQTYYNRRWTINSSVLFGLSLYF